MKLKLIAAAFICILLSGGCNYFKKHRLFSKDVDTILDMTIEEPETTVVPEPDTMQYMIEETYTEPVIEDEPLYPGTSGRYFMIVGSFQNQNLARIYAEKIQQMGYQTQVIEGPNGFYRVSAKSYDDFRQGVSEIEEFRTAVTEHAWLHVKK